MRWFGIVLLLMLLVGCSSAPAPTPQTLTVSAHEFAFAPEALEVTVGQPVRLILKNEGTVEHDFVIMQIPLAAAPSAPVSDHTTDGHQHGEVTPTPADHAADGHQHGEAIDPDNQVHVAAAAGGTSTVEFTPTEAGTYEVYCSVPGHKEAGMVAQVVVTGP